MNSRGDALAFERLVERLWRALARNQRRKVHFIADKNLGKNFFKLLAFLAVYELAGARVGHEKTVEHNAIVPAENLRAQNIDSGRRKRSGDFAEQALAIPRADFHDGVAAVRLIVPIDDRLERFFFLGQLMVHEAVRLGEIGKDFARVTDLEVTPRQSLEMRFDLVGA